MLKLTSPVRRGWRIVGHSSHSLAWSLASVREQAKPFPKPCHGRLRCHLALAGMITLELSVVIPCFEAPTVMTPVRRVKTRTLVRTARVIGRPGRPRCLRSLLAVMVQGSCTYYLVIVLQV